MLGKEYNAHSSALCNSFLYSLNFVSLRPKYLLLDIIIITQIYYDEEAYAKLKFTAILHKNWESPGHRCDCVSFLSTTNPTRTKQIRRDHGAAF